MQITSNLHSMSPKKKNLADGAEKKMCHVSFGESIM